MYRLVRPVARYVLGYYFRNIDLSGLENIPRDKAVILAANHPTAFIEPCLLACFQPRPLHFLARGDLFKNRFFSRLLASLNILPVYRLKDGGYAKLTRNYATFEACHEVLHRRGALMILAEGSCVHEKRLRPLQKGTARVALGALKGMPDEDVYVVPVSVNFAAAERFRTTVSIHCGGPISAHSHLGAYEDNEAMGLQSLTDAIRDRLEQTVVQLPKPPLEAYYQLALDIASTNIAPPLSGVTHTGRPLVDALRSVQRYQLVGESLPEFAEQLSRDRLTVDEIAAAHPSIQRPTAWRVVVAGLLLLPQLPVWGLARGIASVGPKTIEFYSPVRFAVMAVATLIYVPAMLMLNWPFLLYLLPSLYFTAWSLTELERFDVWRKSRRRYRRARAHYPTLKKLRSRLLE